MPSSKVNLSTPASLLSRCNVCRFPLPLPAPHEHTHTKTRRVRPWVGRVGGGGAQDPPSLCRSLGSLFVQKPLHSLLAGGNTPG